MMCSLLKQKPETEKKILQSCENWDFHLLLAAFHAGRAAVGFITIWTAQTENRDISRDLSVLISSKATHLSWRFTKRTEGPYSWPGQQHKDAPACSQGYITAAGSSCWAVSLWPYYISRHLLLESTGPPVLERETQLSSSRLWGRAFTVVALRWPPTSCRVFGNCRSRNCGWRIGCCCVISYQYCDL